MEEIVYYLPLQARIQYLAEDLKFQSQSFPAIWYRVLIIQHPYDLNIRNEVMHYRPKCRTILHLLSENYQQRKARNDG